MLIVLEMPKQVFEYEDDFNTRRCVYERVKGTLCNTFSNQVKHQIPMVVRVHEHITFDHWGPRHHRIGVHGKGQGSE